MGLYQDFLCLITYISLKLVKELPLEVIKILDDKEISNTYLISVLKKCHRYLKLDRYETITNFLNNNINYLNGLNRNLTIQNFRRQKYKGIFFKKEINLLFLIMKEFEDLNIDLIKIEEFSFAEDNIVATNILTNDKFELSFSEFNDEDLNQRVYYRLPTEPVYIDIGDFLIYEKDRLYLLKGIDVESKESKYSCVENEIWNKDSSLLSTLIDLKFLSDHFRTKVQSELEKIGKKVSIGKINSLKSFLKNINKLKLFSDLFEIVSKDYQERQILLRFFSQLIGETLLGIEGAFDSDNLFKSIVESRKKGYGLKALLEALLLRSLNVDEKDLKKYESLGKYNGIKDIGIKAEKIYSIYSSANLNEKWVLKIRCCTLLRHSTSHLLTNTIIITNETYLKFFFDNFLEILCLELENINFLNA